MMADWISVKDRLPETKPFKCLCYSAKHNTYTVGTYTDWGWMFPYFCGEMTHWMPLPEPPKEVDNGN